MKKLIFSVLLASSLIGVVGITSAQCVPSPGITCPPSNVNSVPEILQLIGKIFGFFFAIVIALASVFLLYAAFLYVTSRGEGEKIEKAKTIIIYAVAALIVAAIAAAIPTIVSTFVG